MLQTLKFGSTPPNYLLYGVELKYAKSILQATKQNNPHLKHNFMKYNFLPIAFSAAALLFSCSGKKTEDNAAVADTTVIRDTVVQTVTQPVDTAAIIAAYEAEYAKTKSKNTKPVYKAKATKQVTAYPEPEIQSVAPATETIDVAGFNYVADKHASYPGGRAAFLQYFYKNFEYPERAIQNNIQGTVYAEVFISETGVVEKVEFPDVNSDMV